MNEMTNEIRSREDRRPYLAPAVTSREVKSASVFRAASQCGFGCEDFGKFRRPSR